MHSKERYIFKHIQQNLKLIANSSGLETNFIELKYPVAFLSCIKNVKYRWKKHDISKENLIDTEQKQKLELNLNNKRKPWLISISF